MSPILSHYDTHGALIKTIEVCLLESEKYSDNFEKYKNKILCDFLGEKKLRISKKFLGDQASTLLLTLTISDAT